MSADDRVRLFYADTSRGGSGQAQAAKLLEGVQASRGGGDAGAGPSVAEVARRHGLNANMVFMWRGDPRFGPGRDAPEFLPVEVRPADLPVTSELVLADAESQVEITLSSGHRLTLRGPFDVDVVLRLVRGLTTP